jgi:chitinase
MGPAWNYTHGSGVVVAVLDTGFTDHPDLAANLVPGYDFITDPAIANDGGGRDGDAHDPGDWVAAGECGASMPAASSTWHGTHTAGIVAAVTNNGMGVAGVAFEAKVQPVRVLGKCGGWASDIADAIVWSAGGSVPGVPANPTPAEVISLSLSGFGRCDAATQAAIDQAVAAGSVVLAAAGNDGKDVDAYSPANCRNVVTVGAGNKDAELSAASNYGMQVDITAPGYGGIVSTINSGTTTPASPTYGKRFGTSLATAHAAGVAAMIEALGPRSPQLVEGALMTGVRPFEVTWPADFARPRSVGLLDASKAMAVATEPFMYITTSKPTIVEGDFVLAGAVEFDVRLSQPLDHDVTFQWDIRGDDIPAAMGTPVIHAGQTSYHVSATVYEDTSGVVLLNEPTAPVYLILSHVAGIHWYQDHAMARVLDNDGPMLDKGVPLASPADLEGTRKVFHFYVPGGASHLQFHVDGHAGEDNDLYVRRGALATLADYDCASTGPGSIEACTFEAPEAGDYFVVAHARSDHTGFNVTADYVVTTPTVQLSIADVTVNEASSPQMVFAVSLSAPPAGPVQVTAEFVDGTAWGAVNSSGNDYSYISRTQVLDFAPGQQTVNLYAYAENDWEVEQDETFTVHLSSPHGAVIADGEATGTIIDDDRNTPPATLSVGDVSIAEGNSGTKVMTFTATLSQAATVPVTFQATTESSGAVSYGTTPDFVALDHLPVTIPAGQLSATFGVTIIGDTAYEDREDFGVRLSAVQGATVPDPLVTALIENDDMPTLRIGDASIVEGNSGTQQMVFTVTLSNGLTNWVTFNAATQSGTATVGSDFTGFGATTYQIGPGYTTKTISVPITGDTKAEADETLKVNLSAVTGAALADGQGIGTIVNDDLPDLRIGDASIGEGNNGTKVMTFAATLSQVATSPVTFYARTQAGTATAGNDFVGFGLTAFTIPAGQQAATVGVTINGDTVIEANETVQVYLSSVVGATLLDGQGLGTIVNDDVAGLRIYDTSVSEGNSGTKVMTFNVILSQAQATPVTFSARTQGGTAVADADFASLAPTTYTIPSGQILATIDVTVKGDTTFEANEALLVNLSAATGATLLDGQGIGTITNDDAVGLRIGDASISEGNSGTKVMTFTATLAQTVANPVTFSARTQSGTAAAGSDFVAFGPATFTIPAGQLTTTVDVVVNGDTTVEADETFMVNLSAAAGATLLDGQGVGTLRNDD